MADDLVEVPAGTSVADFPTGYARKSDLLLHIAATCEHDFDGWRHYYNDAGKVMGGEEVCKKCGLGAMAHSLRTGI